jgi:hypothetical protein
MVMNLPDIGRAPLGVASSDHGQLLTQVSQLFNITLAAAFKLQQRRFGGKVTLIDAFNFIDGVIANFRTYGFRVSTAGAGCNLAAQVQKAVIHPYSRRHCSVLRAPIRPLPQITALCLPIWFTRLRISTPSLRCLLNSKLLPTYGSVFPEQS